MDAKLPTPMVKTEGVNKLKRSFNPLKKSDLLQHGVCSVGPPKESGLNSRFHIPFKNNLNTRNKIKNNFKFFSSSLQLSPLYYDTRREM